MIYFPLSGVSGEIRGAINAVLNLSALVTIEIKYDNGAPVDLTGAVIAMSGIDMQSRGGINFGGVLTGGVDNHSANIRLMKLDDTSDM